MAGSVGAVLSVGEDHPRTVDSRPSVVGSNVEAMKYKTRVKFSIKRKHVHSHYQDKIAVTGPMGFQVIINMSMKRWIPKESEVTWVVISNWVESL